MEIIVVIIAVIALFIFLTGKSGVGIKSSLVKEIHFQYSGGIGSSSKYYPSISLAEAYEALSVFDSSNRFRSNTDNYSFWALIYNEPCLITLKAEPFKKGCRLLVTKGADHNQILRSLGMKEEKFPTNLKSI
ncbi:hypothetical protein [Lonepinella sp. BR2357]|uniref:hypothetical protein n=1 Tax=Lonepinella sp. BR2357 TaxID=3434549 RepID=UPI003F6DA8F4